MCHDTPRLVLIRYHYVTEIKEMSSENTSKYQSLDDMRRTVSETGLRNVLTVPGLATLSSTFLTFPSLQGNALVTRAMGQSLRLACESLRRTTSPSGLVGPLDIYFGSEAKYSRLHLLQKISARCCTCFHCCLWRLDSEVAWRGRQHADLLS